MKNLPILLGAAVAVIIVVVGLTLLVLSGRATDSSTSVNLPSVQVYYRGCSSVAEAGDAFLVAGKAWLADPTEEKNAEQTRKFETWKVQANTHRCPDLVTALDAYAAAMKGTDPAEIARTEQLWADAMRQAG